MIKNSLFFLMAAAIFCSCNNNQKTNEQTGDTAAVATPNVAQNNATTAIQTDSLVLKDIALSTKLVGTFPYLSYPKDYNFNYKKEATAADIKNVDKEYFAVNGQLLPIEGKSFKAWIHKDQNTGGKFNSMEVEKYYHQKILDLGGVQVNNVEVAQTELKRIGDSELITNKYGFSIDYNLLDRIKTYVIKTKDKAIWIQFNLMNEEVGRLAVVEQEVK